MDPERDLEGIEVEYLNKTGAIDGRRLLEIGCGNGRLAWRYASFAAATEMSIPSVMDLSNILGHSQVSVDKDPVMAFVLATGDTDGNFSPKLKDFLGTDWAKPKVDSLKKIE